MKKGGFYDIISTVKKEITIQNELLSKIKWACTFSNCEPKIKNGNLRRLEKFNVAYVEPHKAIIKDKTYLFFNYHDYFYINDLTNKYPLSSLREIIKAN